MKTKYIILSIFCLFFEMQVCYSQEIDFIHNRFAVVINDSNFHLDISVKLTYPVVQQKDTNLLNIRRTILSEIFETPTDSVITDSLTLITIFFGIDSLELEIERAKEFDLKAKYRKEIDVNSRYVNSNILYYRIFTHTYLNKARGYTKETYLTFNLSTGKRLTEEDIFKENYQEVITQFILKKLKKENPKDVFYKDKVRPNGNFFVDEEGITYLFNSNEIAAFGHIKIFIPYKEIKAILKDESPIRSLINVTVKM